VLSLFLISFVCDAAGDPPATQPVNELAVESPIRHWFNQLADPDPKVRDKAKIDLMGIKADDLPGLRQLVIDKLPILPAQASALHDIVMQAFLASEPYKVPGGDESNASGTNGPFFLGIFWPNHDEDDEARFGVTVDERLPGFPSYQFLRQGDMILGVYIHPDEPLLQLPNMETHSRSALIAAIAGSPGTQNVVLEVLRNGEPMKIAVKMAPRPLDADGVAIGAIQAFNAVRVDRADAYFHENFAPLLEDQEDVSKLAEGR
jgi:hypothetical protein